MGLLNKMKEPIILKEDCSAKQQLSEMEQLLSQITDSKTKASLEHDIAAVKAGILGEDTILFELKNSHLPMFILHDLLLKYEGLTAQIDFLVITRKLIFVLECKNLYGNITITNSGDFIRVVGSKKEGIYSPITQGKRHLELIKQMKSAQRENAFSKALFDRNFYYNYCSVVVLANPKTILDAKYAKKEVKEQVIRADQLIEYIKKANAQAEISNSSDSDMENLANYFLTNHHTCNTDYLEKYRNQVQPVQEQTSKEQLSQLSTSQSEDSTKAIVCPRCGSPMIMRKASKGVNAGSEFWGCSNFPKCRCIISDKSNS